MNTSAFVTALISERAESWRCVKGDKESEGTDGGE